MCAFFSPLACCRCCFEHFVSGEVTMRLHANPRLRAALDALPPKMLALSSDKPPQPISFAKETLNGRVEHVVESIQRATFTGAADKAKVINMYKEYRDVTLTGAVAQMCTCITSPFADSVRTSRFLYNC